MTTFPAILVGGPPHSGKSILIYSLTQALRQAGIEHYVLRACPDGEGDWSNEIDQKLAETIRVKGQFNSDFVQRMDGWLAKRHLPLLVDVGGQPNEEQAAMFARCTHAVLLVGRRADDPEAYGRSLSHWRQLMAQQGVTIIAELASELDGDNVLTAVSPIIQGTLTGLNRGQTASGPAFDALLQKINHLFAYPHGKLVRQHLALSPHELTLNLEALEEMWRIENSRWQPAHIPQLQAYLPEKQPLAVYGRTAAWLYAALAMHAHPAPFAQFDVRYGWVTPPALTVVTGKTAVTRANWHAALISHPGYTELNMNLQGQLLDYDDAHALPIPAPPPDKGLILNGRLPLWLPTAIVRQLAPMVLWTAVYQPQLNAAVIIHSHTATHPVSHTIPFRPPKVTPNRQS
ncbi:MAG: CRISPR-associated protein Csx3 [Candidatus Promineifilaceae bacterium]